MFQLVHMHGMWIFQEGGLSLVSFLWGGERLREIGWLFGAARGLEAPDLGAECGMGFCYLFCENEVICLDYQLMCRLALRPDPSIVW